MDTREFRKRAHELADWMADYFEQVEQYPVKSKALPGDIYQKLPENPPQNKESFDQMMDDLNKIIMPGITHWQSPHFHAYFPANSSYPSVLGEMITAAIGAQGMVWETSPAAAELEEKVMDWLKQMLGLPSNFHGVIQDTGSTATLVALLSAREKQSQFRINSNGFDKPKYRIYSSSEAHSSIEKGVKVAGFGKENLIKIKVDEELKIIPDELEKAIIKDIKDGYIPTCVVAALGTTGTVAIDELKPLTQICKKHKIWLHVDAAYAGSALILEEYRGMIEGIEEVDSFYFNPHKWMFTNFDCSAYFVRDKEMLIKTFSITPEYLKTDKDDHVNNYRDWGIQLGRRFRALKLWFVIRSMGVEGIMNKIRNHIKWAKELAQWIENEDDFKLLKPQHLAVVCFHVKPKGNENKEEINAINEKLINNINQSGQIYLSHYKVNGQFIIRIVLGQTYLKHEDVLFAWEIIKQQYHKL
jgi:aromatic-L-amino-acid/L-tryptophan decarboxylase